MVVLGIDGLDHHAVLISTPHTCLLCVYVKDHMYRNNTHTVKELRNEIVSVFIRITADILC
jgi:phosphoribosyl-dephospho-CoA transferase